MDFHFNLLWLAKFISAGDRFLIGSVPPTRGRQAIARDRERKQNQQGHRTYDSLQHMVRDVARAVADGMGGRVRKDDRCLRGGQRIQHRRHGDVRQVHDHAEPIHLGHDERAEVGEAPDVGHPARLINFAAVRPRRVARVREGEIAGAELVERAQHTEAGADRVAALDPDQAGQLAGAMALLDACGEFGEWKEKEKERERERGRTY